MKNKSQLIMELYQSLIESKDIVKSRKMKLAWKKYRNKFQFGINRHARLSSSILANRPELMKRLKRSLELYKNKRKSEKLKLQKHLEKTQLNLKDSI